MSIQKTSLKERLQSDVTFYDMQAFFCTLAVDYFEAFSMLTGLPHYKNFYCLHIFPLEAQENRYFDLWDIARVGTKMAKVPSRGAFVKPYSKEDAAERAEYIRQGAFLLKGTFIDPLKELPYFMRLRKRDPEAYQAVRERNFIAYQFIKEKENQINDI